MNSNLKKSEELADSDSPQAGKQGGKKKALQWELWQCCDNMCSFCYLGEGNKKTSKERQLLSLSNLNATLDNFDSETYDTVGLIGGEFFQGQIDDADVNKAFFEVVGKLKSLRDEGSLKSIWITATLTKENLDDFWKTLRTLHNQELDSSSASSDGGVWVCTSWDPRGRFHTKKLEQTWENNVNRIAEEFPWVNVNTSVILTQIVCEMYLNNEFVPKDFMKKHHVTLSFIQPRIYDYEIECNKEALNQFKETQSTETVEEYLTNLKKSIEERLGFRFYPDRRTFRKFLLKFVKNDADIWDAIFNVDREADEVYKNFSHTNESERWEADKKLAIEVCAAVGRLHNPNCEREPYDNKHPIDFATYCDSNACMICDRDQVWRSVNG